MPKSKNNQPNVLKVDEKFFTGLRERLRKEKRYDVTEEQLGNIVAEYFKHVGEELGSGKSTDESYTVEHEGFISFTVSYRAGKGESSGNFGIGVTAGEEIKKAIKDDLALEEKAADDDDDEEDDD